jgi:hypothetical protein
VVQHILYLRIWLKRHSALGEFGAAALRAQLQSEQICPLPSTRTIGRILLRHDLVQRSRRRQLPPPLGWYLPAVAQGHAELDYFDIVEGLVIRRGSEVQVLNGISLYGSLAVSWQRRAILTVDLLRYLPQHWQRFGCPHYVQFDNDTRFQGTHRHPECLGRVVHLCLCLGIVPVFAPPRETGFQAKIESFNHLWQQKVWQRWRHRSVPELASRSHQFVLAHRLKHAPRAETAPMRLRFPDAPPTAPTQPMVIFLRRTDEQGRLHLLRQSVRVDRHWPHRLVRLHLDVHSGQLWCYALRRRAPRWQPLLRTTQLEITLSPWHRNEL